MDDFGREHKVLGQQLKIWSDRYGCILENKGGSMPSAHINFIVTSQYSIEEIFWEDKTTLEALLRRFKLLHMPSIGKVTITRWQNLKDSRTFKSIEQLEGTDNA